MDLDNKPILEELLDTRGENLVSLFLPTHPYGRQQQQDPIRFNNLLTEAKDRLGARGMGRREINEFLQELIELESNEEFWQHQDDGLAIFVSQNFTKVFRMPVRFEETVHIGERFMISPLLPAYNNNETFYILALSQAEIRLFKNTRYTILEMDLGEIPTSIDEALWADDAERHLQIQPRTKASGAKGKDIPGFHGHGVIDETYKADIKPYFQKVDQGLMKLLDGRKNPLVLFGVQFLLPIYREISAYPSIPDQEISGNPEEKDKEILHKEGWEIVEPLFNNERNNAIKHGKHLIGAGSELASSDLESIIPAAFYGRIETLFIGKNNHIWGNLDESTKKFQLHQIRQPGDEDLLNVAAVQTLTNSGSVYVIEQTEIPENADIVAIFRYSMTSNEEQDQ